MCSGLFFFFKQKTAYELRISDWSSDVCSSDLRAEILVRMASYAADPRPEVRTVMENNLEIAQLLTEAIHLAEANTNKLAEVRPEERRVGKECVSMCRSRWSPVH